MAYWLVKSEPETWSWDAQVKAKATGWDGVRNHQAANNMKAMALGDLAFFYHSNCAEPGIAGIVKIVKEAYPDHTAFDADDPHYDADSNPDKPRWYMVDVQLERKFASVITLTKLREHAERELAGLQLLKRGNRLSVTPVSAEHWKFILSLAR